MKLQMARCVIKSYFMLIWKINEFAYFASFVLCVLSHLKLSHLFLYFHCFSCVGVDEDDAPDIDIYHCPNCEKTHGKSTCEYL